MNKPNRLAGIIILCFAGLGPTARIEAGPVDWLRAVGHSISHPQHHPVRHARKNAGRPRPATVGQEGSDDPVLKSEFYNNPAPSPTAAPTVSETNRAPEKDVAAATPSPAVRAASAPAISQNGDLPYGVPVAGKPGFVTSPYAPTGGYVDVRNLPSGIQVKDPYTGKIFLTP